MKGSTMRRDSGGAVRARRARRLQTPPLGTPVSGWRGDRHPVYKTDIHVVDIHNRVMIKNMYVLKTIYMVQVHTEWCVDFQLINRVVSI